jgi:hypothetical protein
MNNCKINIWGRDFELPVSYDCYPGEDVIDTQEDALTKFLSATEVIEASQTNIVEYVLSDDMAEIDGFAIDNIFKYVMPKSIYIPRSKKNRVIAFMCNYKFDEEHGLAVVFENEAFSAIGAQDIVL